MVPSYRGTHFVNGPFVALGKTSILHLRIYCATEKRAKKSSPTPLTVGALSASNSRSTLGASRAGWIKNGYSFLNRIESSRRKENNMLKVWFGDLFCQSRAQERNQRYENPNILFLRTPPGHQRHGRKYFKYFTPLYIRSQEK